MKISWQGHASFIIESEDIILVTDPFDEQVGYPHICQQADVVTVSHQHWDHDAVQVFKNSPRILMGPGLFQYGHMFFHGLPSWHDSQQGAVRGTNTIFVIEAEGMKIVHLGDLGHVPEQQADMIGQPDILLLPVGGTYTLDAEKAWQTAELLQPRLIIPMHYRTSVCKLDILPLEPFVERCPDFTKKPYLETKADQLASLNGAVLVLDYLH